MIDLFAIDNFRSDYLHLAEGHIEPHPNFSYSWDMLSSLHPPLAAFPFALITLVTILEFINLFKRSPLISSAVKVNLGVAVVAVALAFFSGYPASDAASQTFKIPDEVISWHHTWGRLLLFAIAPCFLMKILSLHAKELRRVWLALYLVLLLVCQGLVIYTGYLGGELVFLHGAGVQAK